MLPWLAHCVSSFCLGRLGRLSLRACRSSFSQFQLAEDRIVIGDASWQLGLSLLILGCFFLLRVGLGLCMKWVEAAEFFGPTIASQNPTVRLLGHGGGFWCPRAYVTAGLVLSPLSTRASSPVQSTLLAFRCTRRVVINTFMEQCGSLRYTRRAFIGAFMKRRKSSGWGFPWKLDGTYFACNSLFELHTKLVSPRFRLLYKAP